MAPLTVSCIALIIYDTLITIRLEKENIWERKINATSLLYIWTRWTLLLNAVLGLVTAYYSGPTVEPVGFSSLLRRLTNIQKFTRRMFLLEQSETEV